MHENVLGKCSVHAWVCACLASCLPAYIILARNAGLPQRRALQRLSMSEQELAKTGKLCNCVSLSAPVLPSRSLCALRCMQTVAVIPSDLLLLR